MSDTDKEETGATAPKNESAPASEPSTPETAATSAAPSAAAPAGEQENGARVAELEEKLAAMEDKFMRAVADVQNARKRAERDRRDAEAYGGAKLARDLLAVYDNLDQALKLATDELREKEPGFFNGVELTRKELLNAFSKHKISPVEPAIGDKFDPNQHQAMFEAPTPDAETGDIIQVMQSGFTIADRLLRPAMVGVARAADGAPAGDSSDAAAKADAG